MNGCARHGLKAVPYEPSDTTRSEPSDATKRSDTTSSDRYCARPYVGDGL